MRRVQAVAFVATLYGTLLLPLAEAQPSLAETNAPAFREFDFWVGEWELTWRDSANNLVRGTNSISKILDGKVIHESFGSPTTRFYGQSWSVYHPTRKLWQQTWVDNQGSYMEFTGGMNNEKMILSRSVTRPNGTTVHQRMVFFDITKNSLLWRWESSPDEGKTWKQMWRIHYKRKQ
jgi:hypothetical protein